MTFKSTGKSHDHISRTGSAATKGHGTGRVEVLPPHARPWDIVYNSLREQRQVLLDRLDSLMDQMRDVHDALSHTLPFREFEAARRKRDALATSINDLKARLGESREDMKQAARNAVGFCFMEAARAMLTDEQFVAIEASAHDAVANPDLLVVAKKPEGAQRSETHWRQRMSDSRRDAERERYRRRDEQAIAKGNTPRAERLAEKKKKYGGGKLARAENPERRVVWKEF